MGQELMPGWWVVLQFTSIMVKAANVKIMIIIGLNIVGDVTTVTYPTGLNAVCGLHANADW